MEEIYHSTTPEIPEDEAFSLQKEWKRFLQSIAYLIGNWRILFMMAIVGILLGAAYYWLKPVSYVSRTTFVVEESKMGGGSIASALSGQLGFDLGSLSGSSNGILSGDNVLELVKSHKLIRKTLLTAYDSSVASTYSLADKYAEITGLKKKWINSSKVGRQVNFTSGKLSMGRTEDSLLQKVTDEIIKSDLQISKPDRKLGFFELSVVMRDEQLSFLFSQRLLRATIEFYIETKTKRLSNNVKRLQAKADSLAGSLNRKTYSAADETRKLLDANPAYASPEASVEISSRDKYMQATIYAEIVKNLEVSRTALIQETPTIQIVDDPEIPLKDTKMKLLFTLFEGAFIALIIASIFLLARRGKQRLSF